MEGVLDRKSLLLYDSRMYFSILWHHHQPIYRHPESGYYLLPHVNYHLTRNYYQMAVLAEEQAFPCVFNLVPSLLEQIEAYVRGEAEDPLETALEKEPGKLAPEEIALLRRFLPAGERVDDNEELQRQVLLSLFSPLFSPTLQGIKDKEALLEKQRAVWAEVIPLYRRLYHRHQIELTTSAYYHPLLPLIVDLKVADEPIMPSLPFRYPEDACLQIELGRNYFEKIFQVKPSGFWPSEGGLSSEVAGMIARAGFSYAVTDENILWKSLQVRPDFRLLGRPWSCRGLTLFFRDRELSDLISFEYQRWEARAAVDHFQEKLRLRLNSLDERSLLVVALDGENPWAGYDDNGIHFLRELYSRLKKMPEVEPICLSDYLKIMPEPREIELVPGTWLGNFSRWVGHPAKNLAWEKLARVRRETGQNQALLVAEGSDWFWWLGEPGVAEFELLFESYLEAAGKKYPGENPDG